MLWCRGGRPVARLRATEASSDLHPDAECLVYFQLAAFGLQCPPGAGRAIRQAHGACEQSGVEGCTINIGIFVLGGLLAYAPLA